MKELKIRAWAIGYEKWCCRIQHIGDGLWLGYVEKNGREYSTTNIVVEVCVLKDRGGKEVYDGDIVRCRCSKCGKEIVSDVAYIESRHKFKYKTDSDCFEHLGTIDDNEVELIGNIHEHPDLLIKYLQSLDMPEEKKQVQIEKLRKLLNPELSEEECES